MNLQEQTIAFFDREASLAFSTACGLALEGCDDAARREFQRSVQLEHRLRKERARKFEGTQHTKQP